MSGGGLLDSFLSTGSEAVVPYGASLSTHMDDLRGGALSQSVSHAPHRLIHRNPETVRGLPHGTLYQFTHNPHPL